MQLSRGFILNASDLFYPNQRARSGSCQTLPSDAPAGHRVLRGLSTRHVEPEVHSVN